MAGMLTVRMSDQDPPNHRIGIDLGGTKISAILFAPDSAVLDHRRIDSPRTDYRATIAAISGLVFAIHSENGLSSDQTMIGVGTPGAEIPGTGRLQNANSTWLNGQPLRHDLEQALGHPIRMANDANCLALSEARDGAAAGYNCVFAAILGTGIGGGVVTNSMLLDGPSGISGEWGHCALPWPTPEELTIPPCWCGRVGCLETWLSGPSLAADHRRVTGDMLTAQTIAVDDSAACRATRDRHTDRLARGLAMICNILDPDIIVLGGGLSNMAHLYDALPGAIAPYLFTTAPRVRIVQARHGDDSGVRGAAFL